MLKAPTAGVGAFAFVTLEKPHFPVQAAVRCGFWIMLQSLVVIHAHVHRARVCHTKRNAPI